MNIVLNCQQRRYLEWYCRAKQYYMLHQGLIEDFHEGGCFSKMSNAKSLQSECTSFTFSKPKLKLQKHLVDLSLPPPPPPLPTFGPLLPYNPHSNVCLFAPLPPLLKPPPPTWPSGTPPHAEPFPLYPLIRFRYDEYLWGLVQLGFIWWREGWFRWGQGCDWFRWGQGCDWLRWGMVSVRVQKLQRGKHWRE